MRAWRAAEIRASLLPLSEPRLAGQPAKLDAPCRWRPAGWSSRRLRLAPPRRNGPRTYLLLAQNNDELRGTGGFISGAGHVTPDRGKLADLTFADSYAVDNFEQPHTAASAPVQVHGSRSLAAARTATGRSTSRKLADVACTLPAGSGNPDRRRWR